jgi:hypothetical protein
VRKREQGPPSVSQPYEAGKGKGKGDVERLLSIIIKIYTQSALLMFLLDLSLLMTLFLS